MHDPDAVIRAARLWIGTPYRHAASCRGAGADCLGLLIGVWKTLYGTSPETPPPYTPDWGDLKNAEDEPLLAAAKRHLLPVPIPQAVPGNVILFRMTPLAPVKHIAILSKPSRMIHAYARRGVVESPFGTWWRRRLEAAFAFPTPNKKEQTS